MIEIFQQAAEIGYHIKSRKLVPTLIQRVVKLRGSCGKASVYNAFDAPNSALHRLILEQAQALLAEVQQEEELPKEETEERPAEIAA
jgi:hypothetical protein